MADHGSHRCDCGPQLREAVERITNYGGYVLYLRQEGRGIGLLSNNAAYLATKARRGGHDLLLRRLDGAAGQHRRAGPLAVPPDLGFEGG